MHRRTLLAAVGASLSVGGCLSRTGAAGTTPTESVVDGLDASFDVVDSRAPTDDAATAAFEDDRVVVTGTIDPAGCREPVLASVHYDDAAATVRIVVGSEFPSGRSPTGECGNASYDYRCSIAVADRALAGADVVHDYHDREDRAFDLERVT